METRVSSRATRLNDLPMEVLGIICRQLSLRDRVCLSITCRALLHGLASSEDAWGALGFSDEDANENMRSILPWLAHRRQGLRRLQVVLCYTPKGNESSTAAKLAASLEGSPLVHFRLDFLTLSWQGGRALQWLGSCTALTSLTLVHCKLYCLPDALELLPALVDLSLACNRLGEASWGALEQLTALTRLDISWCRLAALPAELAALPALADLSLGGNNDLGYGSWEVLEWLTALTRLNISQCELAALPAELAVLLALAALDLGSNEDLGYAGEDAWAPLAHCSGLTFLGLGRIPFMSLPTALAALAPHLVDICLASTGEEGLWAGGDAALAPLFQLTRLTRLKLHWCLEGQPPPGQLSRLAALQDLDLSISESLDAGVWLLRHLTGLTRLDLTQCNLVDFPEEISHLQALKYLQFEFNLQNLRVAVSWHRLSRLTALTRLNIDECNLCQLPPELAQLPHLAELSLRRNLRLGNWADESTADDTAKWAALEQLTALTCLDASGCNFQFVPAALAALPGLRVLRLADNPNLGRGGMGALRTLTRMTALQHLDLSRCRLPRKLEVDAIPFPLHRLEGWAERIKNLSEGDISTLKLGRSAGVKWP